MELPSDPVFFFVGLMSCSMVVFLSGFRVYQGFRPVFHLVIGFLGLVCGGLVFLGAVSEVSDSV